MPANERTFVMLKPETVLRGLVGPVLARFERSSLRLEALDLRAPDRATAETHYGPDIAARHGEDVRERAVAHITDATVIPAVLRGPNAVSSTRRLVGESFDPSDCSPGTIRADFSADTATAAAAEDRSILNVVHAADSRRAAAAEIDLWFPDL